MRISDWSSDVCSSDLDDARQHVAGLAALLLDDREPELALAGVALLALVEAETDRAEEPLQRLLRRVGARAAPLLADIGLAQRQAVMELDALESGGHPVDFEYDGELNARAALRDRKSTRLNSSH